MTVRSLRFLGIRSAASDAMVRLYRDVLDMEPILERPGATWFRLADGSQVHVYDGADDDHAFFGTGPVVGLVVDDFETTRARMVAAGIEFVGEPQRDGATAWNHYRAPDGNVYEIMGPDRPSGDAAGEPMAADG